QDVNEQPLRVDGERHGPVVNAPAVDDVAVGRALVRARRTDEELYVLGIAQRAIATADRDQRGASKQLRGGRPWNRRNAAEQRGIQVPVEQRGQDDLRILRQSLNEALVASGDEGVLGGQALQHFELERK